MNWAEVVASASTLAESAWWLVFLARDVAGWLCLAVLGFVHSFVTTDKHCELLRGGMGFEYVLFKFLMTFDKLRASGLSEKSYNNRGFILRQGVCMLLAQLVVFASLPSASDVSRSSEPRSMPPTPPTLEVCSSAVLQNSIGFLCLTSTPSSLV